MRIIGFTINKILGQRKSPPKGKLEIKSNIDIKDIQKEDIKISSSQGLKFNFDFTIEYNPKVADINISGSVIAIDDKDESKEVLKEWKKKKFVHPVKVPLFNFIMDKCNLKALLLEDDLGLPMHIPLPRLKPQTAQQTSSNPANYAG